MLVPNRHASSSSYRYGFNGKEKDDEIKGEGLQYDYGFRIYDPRIGKFLSTDPLSSEFPWWSPYHFSGNTPIWATDLDGLETWYTNNGSVSEFGGPLSKEFRAKNGLLDKKPNVASSSSTSSTEGKKPALKTTNSSALLKKTNTPSNFEKYQAKVFNHEGGYVNDPDDPGGATNKGITIGTFKLYAKKDLNVEPTLDNLKNLTNYQAAIIYKNNYWDNVKGDDINNGSLAYALYDFNVNAGGNAVKVLQRTLNEMEADIKVDGKMCKNTVEVLNNFDSKEVFEKFQENRKKYYQDIISKNPKLKKFEKGWNKRVDSIKYEEN